MHSLVASYYSLKFRERDFPAIENEIAYHFLRSDNVPKRLFYLQKRAKDQFEEFNFVDCIKTWCSILFVYIAMKESELFGMFYGESFGDYISILDILSPNDDHRRSKTGTGHQGSSPRYGANNSDSFVARNINKTLWHSEDMVRLQLLVLHKNPDVAMAIGQIGMLKLKIGDPSGELFLALCLRCCGLTVERNITAAANTFMDRTFSMHRKINLTGFSGWRWRGRGRGSRVVIDCGGMDEGEPTTSIRNEGTNYPPRLTMGFPRKKKVLHILYKVAISENITSKHRDTLLRSIEVFISALLMRDDVALAESLLLEVFSTCYRFREVRCIFPLLCNGLPIGALLCWMALDGGESHCNCDSGEFDILMRLIRLFAAVLAMTGRNSLLSIRRAVKSIKPSHNNSSLCISAAFMVHTLYDILNEVDEC